jgi:hypothetical protein
MCEEPNSQDVPERSLFAYRTSLCQHSQFSVPVVQASFFGSLHRVNALALIGFVQTTVVKVQFNRLATSVPPLLAFSIRTCRIWVAHDRKNFLRRHPRTKLPRSWPIQPCIKEKAGHQQCRYADEENDDTPKLDFTTTNAEQSHLFRSSGGSSVASSRTLCTTLFISLSRRQTKVNIERFTPPPRRAIAALGKARQLRRSTPEWS